MNLELNLTASRRQWLLGAAAALLCRPALTLAADTPPPVDHSAHAGHGDHGAAASLAPAPTLPGASLYRLPITLTDQNGRNFTLADQRGTPTVISMFYTSCQFTCPMLVQALQADEGKLSAAERARLKVLLVSFDPEHDTVAQLRKTAQAQGVDPTRWTLARADAASVRKLAALLGVQYRAVGKGDFNHTTQLVLLDGNGQIAARTGEVAGADAAFVKDIKRVLQQAAAG